MRYPASAARLSAQVSGRPADKKAESGQWHSPLAGWLARQETYGMLGADDGRPAAGTVAAAQANLRKATVTAGMLSDHLDALHNSISGLKRARSEPAGRQMMSGRFDPASGHAAGPAGLGGD